MARPAPNLSDRDALIAYRKELRGVAPLWRYSGITMAVLGAALLVLRSKQVIHVHVLVPILIIVAAIVLMSIAILQRSLYHARRMRGAG